MTTQIASSLYEQLTEEFKESKQLLTEGEQLLYLRKNAFEKFRLLGFPSIKNEDWKYTNVVPFLKEDFETEVHLNGNRELIPSFLKSLSIPGLDSYKIILLNGKIAADLPVFAQENKIKLLPIGKARNEEVFQTYFGKNVDIVKNSFAALNTAMFSDGLFIEVSARTALDKPIHIINIYTSEKNIFLQPRNLIVAHPGSSFQIIESIYNTDDDSAIFVNTVTEVVLEENANIEHVYLQTGKKGKRFIQHTEVLQQHQSVYNNFTFSLPAADFIRNNLNISLDAKHAEAHLYGLYLALDHQLIDNHSLVDHRMPECNSNEHYKGVLLGNSRAVFNGKIFVRKDAQKTNAFQQNNNLLLSEKAVINSKPQLEIFADDVKCSHGATIGNLNKDALFYLQSRGIGEDNARNLLVNAFAFDVTDKIKNIPLKTHIQKLIKNFMANLYD